MSNIKKIEKLTPEQRRMLVAHREKSLKSALNTDPLDQDRARKAIEQLYISTDMKPPKEYFFHTSPFKCLEHRSKILLGREPAPGEKIKVENQPIYFLGSWDIFWISVYEFALMIGNTYNPDVQRKFDAYKEYAYSCGISYLYPEAAFISERPEKYVFNAQYQLHNDAGPALKFRDDFELYAWRDIIIERDWIERKHDLKIAEILKERNAEHRRIKIEIYTSIHGPASVIKDSKAKLINEDVNHGQPRKLYDIMGQRFIHVVNGSLEPDGTRREFLLGVQSNINNPHEAIAVSYGIPAHLYKEAIRT